VQHGRFAAEVTLPMPAQAGVAAGLALFQSEKQHLVLSLRRGAVVLESCDAGAVKTVAQAACPEGPVSFTLRLRCDGPRVQAEWSPGDAPPQPLGAALDARVVSVQAAGGGIHFTGAVVGPCAFTA
jgi:alpha-N-arabinofuranosidase